MIFSMGIEKTFQVISEMQAEGVIGRFAIGGAVAAFFYIEPGTTYDLDVFIAWEPGYGGLLDIGPIYAYLKKRGYHIEGECIYVEGWAVQFLPTTGRLTQEALEEASSMRVGETTVPIFSREHLMAICLETGRPKDIARLLQFIEAGDIDEKKLDTILVSHSLKNKWNSFMQRTKTL